MRQNNRIYALLIIVAIVVVPIAPAFVFGHSQYTEILTLNVPQWLAIFVGALAAIGLESVGILSGHSAVYYWERRDYIRSGLSVVILIAYLFLGIFGVLGILEVGVVMFLIMPLVYLLSGMFTVSSDSEQKQLKKEDTKAKLQLEELKTKRTIANAAARKAKWQAESKANATEEPTESGTKLTKTFQKLSESPEVEKEKLSSNYGNDWRNVPNGLKREILTMTVGEVQEKFGVPRRTANNWLRYAKRDYG